MGDGWQIGAGPFKIGSQGGGRIQAGPFSFGGGPSVGPFTFGVQPSGRASVGMFGVQRSVGQSPNARAGNVDSQGRPSLSSQVRPQAPLSIGDWNTTYNSLLTTARGQNAMSWADNEAKLAGLLDSANQRKIEVDFSRMGRGIDANLANALYAAANGGAGVDRRAIDQQDQAARDYYNLIQRGLAADEGVVNENAAQILRQLAIAKEQTETGRREGRQIKDKNVRNIEGAGTGAGALFSSAVRDQRTDEANALQILMDQARSNDLASQLQYDEADTTLRRKRGEIGEGRQKADYDLWYKVLDLNNNRQRIDLDSGARDAKYRAEQQMRGLAGSRDNQSLASFLRGIKGQQDAFNGARLMQEMGLVTGAQSGANALVGTPPVSKPRRKTGRSPQRNR